VKLREFDWSAEASATKHGFTREDIESAFAGRTLVSRSKVGVYVLLGKDEEDHFLEICYRITDKGKILVFHCMEMRGYQKRRFKKGKK